MKGGSKAKASDNKLAVKKGGTTKAAAKPVKKAKEVKDPNKPKRPASAFFVFMEDFMKTYKEKHPNSKSVADVGKAGGAKWKQLTAAEKAPYSATAEKRKVEYEKTMKAYNKKLADAPEEKEESAESDKSQSEVHDEKDDDDDEDDSDEITLEDLDNNDYSMNFDPEVPISLIVPGMKESSPSVSDTSSSIKGGVKKFSIADILSDARRDMALVLEDKVKTLMLKSPPESLSSIVSGLNDFYEEISRCGNDPTPLKAKVNAYVAEVDKLLIINSTCSEKISRKAATDRLAKNAFDMKQISAIITSTSNDCRELEARKVDLTAQLDEVQRLLLDKNTALNQHREQITQLEKEREVLNKTPVLTLDEDEHLASFGKKIDDLQAIFRRSD